MSELSLPPSMPHSIKKLPKSKQWRLACAVETLETRVLLASTPVPVSFEQPTFIPAPVVGGTDDNRPFGPIYLEDLSGNGKLDIVALTRNGVQVNMGNGDGTFKPPQIYPVYNDFAGGPAADKDTGVVFDGMVMAHLSGDGSLDAVVVESAYNRGTGPNGGLGHVSVLMGNGDGTFKAFKAYTTGPNSRAVTVGDFNGHPDIAVTNDYNRTVSILLGDGNGHFNTTPLTLNVGNEPYGIETINVYEDDLPDLVVGNSTDATLSFLIDTGTTNGVPNFKPQFVVPVPGATSNTTGSSSSGAVGDLEFLNVADINGDGKQDLITPYNVYLNNTAANGLASNAPITFTPVNGGGAPEVIGKVNIGGDGYDSVAVSSSYSIAAVSLGNSAGTFGQFFGYYSTVTGYGFATGYTTAPTNKTFFGLRPDGIAVGDLNGDGLPDIVVADYGFNTQNTPTGLSFPRDEPAGFTVMLAIANHTFDAPRGSALTNPFTSPSGIAGVDSNGFPTSNSVVGRNDYPNSITVADINGDGEPVLQAIITADYGAAATATTSNGVTTFKPSPNYPGSIEVQINDGAGHFTASQELSDAYGPDAVAVADFTGDGIPDLVVADRFKGQIEIFKGNGDGTFNPTATIYAVGTHPQALVVGNFSGDGNQDIVVANYGTPANPVANTPGTLGSVVILQNQGNGSFAAPKVISGTGVSYYASALAVADFNKDDKEDIAVANRLAGTVNILLGNGDGTFIIPTLGSPQIEPVGIGPAALAVGDFNNDGIPDIAVLNETVESLTILKGNSDASFSIQQVYDFPFFPATPIINPKPSKLDSAPVSLAVADLNGDGTPDIVVAYQGTATDQYYGNGVGILLNRNDGSGFLNNPTHLLTSSLNIQDVPPMDTTSKVVHSLPTDVTTADVTGDGKQDLVILNSDGEKYSGTVSILLNSTVEPNNQNTAPVITSATSTTFAVNVPGTFRITTTGTPSPTLMETGALPTGVMFHDNGNGTATLAGTPAAGSMPSYALTITASNGISPNAVQDFTLDIATSSPPVFGGPTSGTLTAGNSGAITVTATGTPTPTFMETGTFPPGVTLIDNGNGSASISGTPASGSEGAYVLTLTAANGVSPAATELFDLTVASSQTVVISGGVVSVPGTTGSDVISLSAGTSQLTVNVNGQITQFALNQVSLVEVSGFGGDDSITVGIGVPAVYINGGGGNDTIVASNIAADTLRGGAGNDSLSGSGTGNEMLLGAAGNDTLVAGDGDDTLNGGAGDDSLIGGTSADLLDGGAGRDTLVGDGAGSTLLGGNGGDSILSGTASELLDGGGGKNTIDGTKADDIVNGGGNDSIILQG
jgi:Ca2+-binding RTX toxin-like protein